MTFLIPAYLVAAAGVAAGVILLHFVVTREPAAVPLPTARFAPLHSVRARARALRLQDLLLLAFRVGLVLAAGAGLAQPVLRPPRRAVARIVLVDRSMALARAGEAADSGRALMGPGDVLVLFDSVATVVRRGVADSLAALGRSPQRGRLSAALVAALRTASAMREAADSFELIVVSPLVAAELDEATDSVRALWPGVVRMIRVEARPDTAPPRSVAINGGAEDPLRLALPRPRVAESRGAVRGTGPRPAAEARPTVRVVRGRLDAGDSAWARAAPRVLLHWPAAGGLGSGAVPLPGAWVARAALDTVGAVSAGDAVVVAPFERPRRFRGDSAGAGGGVRVVARWVDGEPAAVEEPLGAGCVRTVTIGVPSRGDLVLQPSFARLVQALLERCGGAAALRPADDVRLAQLAGPTSRGRVPGRALAPSERRRSPLGRWLLALALALAVAELPVRRRFGAPPGAAGT